MSKFGATIDPVLATLARPFQRKADTLLDLREWAADEGRGGACVKAYFDLCDDASPEREAECGLRCFRSWLETHLEIVVLDPVKQACVETWPLDLKEETDLESYCRKAMGRLREDRCHAARLLHLEFRFRTGLAA